MLSKYSLVHQVTAAFGKCMYSASSNILHNQSSCDVVSNQNIVIPNNLVMYDGVCNLCNAGVRFCLKHNSKKNNLLFCSMQSEKGKQILKKYGVNEQSAMDRFAFIDEKGAIHRASTACFHIAKHLNFPLNLFYKPGLLLPEWLAFAMYDFVAHNRYKWFGKTSSCQVPAKEIRDRFIDL